MKNVLQFSLLCVYMAIENRLVLFIIQPFENNMTGTIKLKEKDETPLKK